MDCPSHDDLTHDPFLFFPWVTRRRFYDLAWVSISAHGTISLISYASLYSITRSHEEVDMCLVSVSALVISRRVESTERRMLIVGSPRFCRAKAAQAPPQFLNPRNCDGTPNQTHESIHDSFCLSKRRRNPTS